jgi:hypothetical protein
MITVLNTGGNGCSEKYSYLSVDNVFRIPHIHLRMSWGNYCDFVHNFKETYIILIMFVNLVCGIVNFVHGFCDFSDSNCLKVTFI